MVPAPTSSAVSDLPPATTPMMRQYERLRSQLPADVLVFFRLGDFYELFGGDAIKAAPLLNVALTKRNETPMCGVPSHALEHYLTRLVRKGQRVAVCDQVGEVKPGVLVEREISRIISAGTVTDGALLDSTRNHFLAAAFRGPKALGLALLDLTTGQFRVTELPGLPALLDEITRVSPAEIIVSADVEQASAFADLADVRTYDAHAFEADAASLVLREHFKVQSLDGFGCARLPLAVSAAGAILHYLRHELRRPLEHITTLSSYRTDGFLALDASTQAHLEIVQSRSSEGRSLLQAVDRTVTPMGARQLRQWLLYPLRSLETLRARQAAVSAWVDEPGRLAEFRLALKELRDLERAIGRLSQGAGNARDLAALGQSLTRVPTLRALAEGAAQYAPLLAQLAAQLHPLPDLVRRLAEAIADEPAAGTKDGGFIRDGFDAALDELRAASRDGKDWIAALQEREIARTGIKSLKIRFNSVFGYYIEVTRANLSLVPSDYHRKQTTANAERFYTPELKEMEGRILGADERARQLEYELFVRLRDEVLTQAAPLQQTAAALAQLDVLAGFAELARVQAWQRPRLTEPGRIRIRDGRHPVLDQTLEGGRFVPNDLELDAASARLLIITGPNMAGKSTYLRQAALLVLLAQTGSFLPVAEAEIGLVDRIFTRIGASDDLARGQSTFLVEMNETANILHHATPESLVILDEIGRGTSTFDGLSIAWSVAEWLHDEVRTLALFATHYHELTQIVRECRAARNYTVAVREWNDEIVFLHRIIEGAADRSYGLQVARLAGLPAPLLKRARELLTKLEAGGGPQKLKRRASVAEGESQLELI
ncbi:MAG: DNA mismatch repair protein MutS [Verrucomicrobia bacterium]|nr:DNA mismatch repair protein MutS [Verrucomicrobiota bacterium]